MRSKSKVILLRPPEDSPRDFYNIEESLGILYIASWLRKHGITVEVVDSIILDWDVNQTADYLLSEDFDILGITLFNVAVRKTSEILRIVKKEKPSIHVNVGGHYPTFAYREILDNIVEIDSITRFEGENTFLELVEAIRRSGQLNEVSGLALRAKDGMIHTTSLRHRIVALDALPFPIRDTFFSIQKTNKAASICTSRGCWGKCGYCTISPFYSHNGAPSWVGRSPENVVDEIEALYDQLEATVFAFVDAQYFGPGRKGLERVRKIAQRMQERHLKIKYSFDCRPDDVDEELFMYLKETGLSLVYFGLESGCQSQLDRWNRHCTVETGLQAAEILKKLGIIIQTGFILYDPWSSLDEIIQSLQFIRQVKTVSLPLFVRPMEIRPGMALETRLLAEDNIYKAGPFDYQYSFHDCKVPIFRDMLSHAFQGVLELYQKMTRIREKCVLDNLYLNELEQRLIAGATDIALGTALALRDIPPHASQEIGHLGYETERRGLGLKNMIMGSLASIMTISFA